MLLKPTNCMELESLEGLPRLLAFYWRQSFILQCPQWKMLDHQGDYIYEMAFGKKVNCNKTSIFFNKNTPMESREDIEFLWMPLLQYLLRSILVFLLSLIRARSWPFLISNSKFNLNSVVGKVNWFRKQGEKYWLSLSLKQFRFMLWIVFFCSLASVMNSTLWWGNSSGAKSMLKRNYIGWTGNTFVSLKMMVDWVFKIWEVLI